MALDLRFYKSDFSLASMPVDDFNSLIWKEKWNEPGEYSLRLGLDYFQLVAGAAYLYNPDAGRAALIESVDYDKEAQEIVVGGRTAECLLYDRVFYYDYSIISSSDVETRIRNAVNSNCISTSPASRAIPNLVLGTAHGYGITASEISAKSGRSIGDWAFSIASGVGLRPQIDIDFENEQLIFDLKKQSDRTVGNTGSLSPVLFSQSFENTGKDKYHYDAENLLNYAVVKMVDQCYYTQFIFIDRVGEDERRVEVFVDSEASSEPDSDGNPTVTLAQCQAIMRQEGKEALDGHGVEESVSCDVVASGSYKYRTDFYLGDKVSYSSPALGTDIDAEITETKEVYENGAYKLSISVGQDFNGINYLKKVIKKQKRGGK